MQEIPLNDGEWLSVASLSDVGCVRENNEDSLGVFPGPDPERGVLLVVADGMGGAAAGEVASRIAVESVHDEFFRGEDRVPVVALREALVTANAAIHRKAEEDPEYGLCESGSRWLDLCPCPTLFRLDSVFQFFFNFVDNIEKPVYIFDGKPAGLDRCTVRSVLFL